MIDLTHFWEPEPSDYQLEKYLEPFPTPEITAAVEAELGYKLPASFIALMHTQNGGCPLNTCCPTNTPTSWAEDHAAITCIYGIGPKLLGQQENAIHNWEYPPIGVYFGDCPSAGHDMIALDYRECGPHGEPSVVHVDQEDDYRVTLIAPDFESFVGRLVHEDEFAEDPAVTQAQDLEHVQNAEFGPLLQELLDAYPNPLVPQQLRLLAAEIVEDKGYFALHADERSHLLYDLQFLLYTHLYPVANAAAYLRGEAYPSITALTGGGYFSTGGYAPGFVQDWLNAALEQGRIAVTPDGLKFTPQAEAEVLAKLAGLIQSLTA